ncbi:MAG: lipopolysaccharide biosynthesis protein [Fibrobacteraceae bacterium]|nr:lipopolysaccharide biosynthesis protein [Fibrobacteraceae bacterium]
METKNSPSLIELFIRVLNNDLKHFKLCSAIVLIPTITVFVLVMWVIKPEYSSAAIVTPPASSQASLSNLSSMLGAGASGMSSLLNFKTSDNDADAIWTILSSWEIHNQVIEHFNLSDHYEFDGDFHADLLKKFRKNFSLECNDENMFQITIVDEDYNMAAQMVNFVLEKADSAFNVFKTTQARQAREYFQTRLDSCEFALDSLLKAFTKFQVENDFYDPEIQMESTIKYLSELQAKREQVSLEMSFEQMNRGSDTKRYGELQKQYKSVSSALHGSINGKNKNVGLLSLKKSPELGAEYMRMESEIKIQEALYKLLRQQSEQLRLDEAKLLTNLHVLEPPWPNNKKVYPLRGVSLIFTCVISFILASLLCSLLSYVEEERRLGSNVAKEWDAFWNHFRLSKKK